ncbi:MAG: alpha/beta hydrolase [Ginsengibacter sp.]
MKFTRYIAVFAIPIFILSCQKNVEVIEEPQAAAQTMLNVSYGSDALQNMDIYLPAKRTTAATKVCIMIHGGAWTTGDKADFTQYVDTIKRRLPEYAIFNINYRLSAKPANIFPAQENDVKAAIQFIYSNASQYLISKDFILLGASAGAHLAMLQGYKYSTPVKPKAIVSLFGPSDLLDMYNNPVDNNPLVSFFLSEAVGKIPAQDAALYINSSPVSFITNTSGVPTILLHGGLDPLVNASQSVKVKDKLTAAGIANQYVYYPSAGHGDWDNATYFDAFNKIVAFLKANVN